MKITMGSRTPKKECASRSAEGNAMPEIDQWADT